MVGAMVFSLLDSFLLSSTTPLWKVRNSVVSGVGGAAGFFTTQSRLVEENAALREQVAALETKVLSLSRELVHESVLLETLGRGRGIEAVAAAVLSRPPQTPYDIVIIDAGSREGVVNGAEVFLPEGPLLGVVSEVFLKRSRVELYSAPDLETGAVLERGNVPVTIIGRGGGNFKIVLPRDVEVERGDRIVSAGIASRLLAVVEDVTMRPTDSFKEVLAVGPANIFTFRFVLVAL